MSEEIAPEISPKVSMVFFIGVAPEPGNPMCAPYRSGSLPVVTRSGDFACEGEKSFVGMSDL
jgi:hypothetical protein